MAVNDQLGENSCLNVAQKSEQRSKQLCFACVKPLPV